MLLSQALLVMHSNGGSDTASISFPHTELVMNKSVSSRVSICGCGSCERPRTAQLMAAAARQQHLLDCNLKVCLPSLQIPVSQKYPSQPFTLDGANSICVQVLQCVEAR